MSVILYAADDHYGSSGAVVQLGLYPDNSPVVDLEEAWNACGPNFKSILVRPNSMQEFFTAMMIVDSIRARAGSVDTLILPCIPGQRQDRLKWEGDWLMTLKYVAKTINDMGFSKVVSLDPHSIAAEALIDRLVVPEIRIRHMIEQHFINNDLMVPTYSGIIASDAGGSKRAEAAAKYFEVPVYYATKRRDPATNKLSGFTVPADLPDNKRYLVVDDICDAGGTFMGLADATLFPNRTLDLYVTHGIFSKGAVARLKTRYTNVLATDSVDKPVDGAIYLNVSEGLNLYA